MTMVVDSMASLPSRRPQDDAVTRGAGDCNEGSLGLIQRIDRVRLDRKRLEMTAGEARADFPEHRAGCDRGQSERIDADISVLAAIEFQDVERHDAVNGGDQNLPSAQA